MMGGYFDNHPWGIFDGRIVVEAPDFQAMRHFPDYHRTDADFPVAMARTYGKGRTFWSNFGHASETWDDPDIQKMYLEAIKWAMGITQGDVAPRPKQAGQASVK